MSIGTTEAAPGGAECVRVVVRCRPLNSSEVSEGRQRIVSMDADLQQVSQPLTYSSPCELINGRCQQHLLHLIPGCGASVWSDRGIAKDLYFRQRL